MTHLEKYTEITRWIDSFEQPGHTAAVRGLANYIDNTDLPSEMKEQLHLQVNCRIAHLQGEPYFHHKDGEFYLMTEKGTVRIFNTSFSALVVTTVLKLKGYQVKMIQGAFYKVALHEVVPVENFEVAKP